MGEERAVGTVLVVDDDPMLRAVYARSLTKAGFVVEQAEDGLQAFARLGEERFDAIVSDLAMPGMDGIGLLRAVRERDLDVPVVMVTGGASLETAMQAMEHGALRYLTKPVDTAQLVSVMQQAVQLGKMARLKREAVSMLGDSTKLLGDRASLENAFKGALDGLWMAYQPIVHCSQRRTIGYEALLRSSEPTLPHPGAIVDAAERLDALPVLGRAVRRHVAHTVSRSPVPQVFINLHPRDLLDDALYAAEAPLTQVASKIVLEITERASLDHVDDLQSRIASLRQLGYQIAIDDLGAGYAGLGSIAQLEPEIMKLDMALIRDIDVSLSKQSLVGAMIKLCEEMSIRVIAEGIENGRERDTLRRLGCEHMQGYLFAKPAPPFADAQF